MAFFDSDYIETVDAETRGVSVDLQANTNVQAVQFRYLMCDGSDQWAPVRGSTNGTLQPEISLPKDPKKGYVDRFVEVYGRAGSCLGRIGFKSEGGKVWELGSMSGDPFSMKPPEGSEIIAMRGRSGEHLDALGVSFNKAAPGAKL